MHNNPNRGGFPQNRIKLEAQQSESLRRLLKYSLINTLKLKLFSVILLEAVRLVRSHALSQLTSKANFVKQR